jgi:hypothetical protein
MGADHQELLPVGGDVGVARYGIAEPSDDLVVRLPALVADTIDVRPSLLTIVV